VALKRADFKRTQHPIYSFAVWGRYQNELCQMENKDSFGVDSPFDFFNKHNVKNYIIDVSLKNCFTYAHYAEENSGVVAYRYIKNFTGGYIDEYGTESQRTYSMFVRDLNLDVINLIDPIEKDFLEQGAESIIKINSSEIKKIALQPVYDILIEDIIHNKSRKLCTYIGQ
jgi:aminoglycoside 3-N-acetyltransferase